jgi:hypothetical protein
MIAFRTLFILCGAGMLAVAGEPVPLAPPSSFDSGRLQRNPFQRIDAQYLAQKAVVAIAVPAGPAAVVSPDLSKYLRVTSLSLDHPAIAVISGHAFAENETFIARSGQHEFRVLVKRVNQEGAELECAGSVWKIPMTRAASNLEDRTIEVTGKK